jgi:hypothetical protein
MFPNLVSSLRNLASGGEIRRRINARRAALWKERVALAGGEEPAGPTSDLAHEILDNYKSRSLDIRQDYLESLVRDSLSYLEEKQLGILRAADERTLMADSMASLVDQVYRVMESYGFELNRMVGSSELQISCTSPASVTEYEDFNRYRHSSKTITYYRARISTCRLSVIVRGHENQVQFYLLPVGMVMGLSQVEKQHPPIMTFNGSGDCYSVDWEVEGKPLTAERLERYCYLVLDHLLKETREELAASAVRRPSGAA